MLPASFARDGFLPADRLNGKFKRVMITLQGKDNTGKTEFALSAPSPGIALCLDRNYEAVLDNPHPPETRQSDWAFKVIKCPLASQMAQKDYLEYWQMFRGEYKKALANPDARTILIDGDNDSWELQRLAEFGKLDHIPPMQYTGANAARRAHIANGWDSGKIVIATNKLKREYETVTKPNGKEAQVPTGNWLPQGFSDNNYLWQIRLECMREGTRYGIRIEMCKSDTSLVGMELWDSDCCFQSLVQIAYPNVSMSTWGYK